MYWEEAESSLWLHHASINNTPIERAPVKSNAPSSLTSSNTVSRLQLLSLSHRNDKEFSGNQPDQLPASSGFTEQHAPSSELQWITTLPAVFQAATPSADFNYCCPAIATNRRPVTSSPPLQAPHNASCVFTGRGNKSAYHQQPKINCEEIHPTYYSIIIIIIIIIVSTLSSVCN
jgi:hypothetical protein